MFSIYKEAKVKTTTKIKEIQMNNNDINGQNQFGSNLYSF